MKTTNLLSAIGLLALAQAPFLGKGSRPGRRAPRPAELASDSLKFSRPRPKRPERPSVRPGKLIRICPGKRQAWFESNLGPVRKPLAI